MQGTIIEILSIILSVVALLVTIVGFFASLKFYRDGVTLQNKANDALTKIEERTQFIQTQVGGIFDKTLEAAIGKRELLSENFEQLQEGLEHTKTRIVEESIAQIGEAGEQERRRVADVVEREMKGLRQQVKDAKESAEAIAKESGYSGYSGISGLRLWPKFREGQPLDYINFMKLGEILSVKDIAHGTKLSLSEARRLIQMLMTLGILESVLDSATGEEYYRRIA